MKNLFKKHKLAALVLTITLFSVVVTGIHAFIKYKTYGGKPINVESEEETSLPAVEPFKAEKPAEYKEDSLILRFNSGTTRAQKEEYVKSLGGSIEEEIAALNTMIIKVDKESVAEEKLNNSIIAKAENDYYVEVLEDSSEGRPLTAEEMLSTRYNQEPLVFTNEELGIYPEEKLFFNDSEYKNQWAFKELDLEEKLGESGETEASVVAVIDSGVCLDHTELEGKITQGYDFIESDNVAQDELGHGCAVAGIIAANSNNEKGIAGAAPNARIMPLKVVDSKGIGTYSDVAQAIVYAVDHGVDVVNISVGGAQDSEILKAAVEYAVSRNVPVVASSGNTASETMLYPAKYDGVISVGSINRGVYVSSYSSHDRQTDYFAPGESIISLSIDGGVKYYTGTSFAAPYVASLVANGFVDSDEPATKGAISARGTVKPVNFEIQGDALGWGETDYRPEDVRTDVREEFVTAQSSTACVTRYSQGWWAGAACYVEGVWERNTNTAYQYQVVTSGKKYNFNKSGGDTYLGKYVRVELSYTGQYSFGIVSITVLNRAPIGHFNAVDVTNLNVWGWSFDPDTPSISNDVHIYVGGAAGSGAPGYAVTTNMLRSDVNSIYGISGNHGFVWDIPSQFWGTTKSFYIYGINTQPGSNSHLSNSPLTATLTIYDYEPLNGTITNITSNVDKYGYFLPQGNNADILSENNQSISYVPTGVHEDPVNTATGFLDYTAVDLEYADIAGHSMKFTRSYNSDSGYSSILGVGWQAAFDMKIVPTSTNGQKGWTVFFPDGHGETFYDPDNNYRTFDYQFTPASSAIKGVLSRYGATGGPSPYAFIFLDPQTGQQLVFSTDKNVPVLYGKMIQVQTPSGLIVKYNYDANGKLISAVDQTYGRRFDFTLDASGRLVTLKDNTNRQVTFEYNVDGRLYKVTNPVGGITEYNYNASNRLSSVVDPNNKTIAAFTYGEETDPNLKGKVLSRTDGNGKTTTYVYSQLNGQKFTTITDPNGKNTIHEHNDNNYLVKLTKPNGDVTTYEYDTKGQRTKEILPDGKTYQFGYDDKGNRTTSTYPNGYVVTTTYSSNGKPVKIVDGNNDRVKHFNYDGNNNLISTTDANGNSTLFEYDSKNLLTKTVEATSSSTWTDQFVDTVAWDPTKTTKTMADVNGDGKADIVGFGIDDVIVSLSDGNKFLPPQIWHDGFAYNTSWRMDRHVRTTGDINGDGKDDILGFHDGGVYVSFSDGTKFVGEPVLLADLGYNYGWRVDRHVRTTGDVNGDGKDDIVAVSDNEVVVFLSTGSGFTSYQIWNSGFAYNDTWRVDQHPRMVADVNGDGKQDLVGFASAGPIVALSNGTSFVGGTYWHSEYGVNQGWANSTSSPRFVKDVNGDGKADIVGFAGNAIQAAFSDGTKFGYTRYIDTNFATDNGWSNTSYLRIAADVDGNNRVDLVGFGQSGVSVLKRDGNIKTYTYDTNYYLNSETDTGTAAIVSYENNAVGYRTKTTKAEGNIFTTTYNGLGKKLVETDARLNTKSYEYDVAGHVTKEIDEAGVETVYTYDGNYNVTQTKVGVDRITNYEYDNAGNPVKEIQSEGNYAVTTYDDNDRPIKVENFDKENNLLATKSITYNSSDTKASETDANGNVTTYAYDALGRLASETKGGATKTYIYDFWANLTSETDWEGNEYKYYYDKLDRKIRAQNPIEVQNNNPGSIYAYDAVGNNTKIIDSLGFVTEQSFDSQKRLTKVVNPKGRIATYTYDKNGKLVQQSNFAGELTTFTYDGNGNMLTKKDNLNNITSYIYNSRNLNTKITDAESNETTFAYDDHRNNTSITNDLGFSKVFTYDKNGNMLTFKDEENHIKTYAYDGLNRKISEKQNKVVNGTITEVTQIFTYDGNGNIKTQKDGNNNTSTYSYNAFNKLTKITNPDTTEKTFAYSSNGNLLSTTNERGAVTANEYDKLNRKTKTSDPELNVMTQTYDLLGRMVKETDAKAKETVYEYDQLGNITKVTDRAGNITTLTYDDGNRVVTANYPNGLVITNNYDGVGRQLSESKSGNGLSSPVTTSQTFDKVGNIKTQTDPNGNTTTLNYNGVYKVTQIDRPLTLTVVNSYDKKGNLLSTTDEENNMTSYLYDPAGSVIEKIDALGISSLYKYDAAGNLTEVVDGNGNATKFAYNNMNRKIQTKGPGDVVIENIEYDPAGNITKQFDGKNLPTTFTYGLNNKVKTIKDAAENTASVDYDANGNITKQTDKLGNFVAFAYNDLDRVSQKTDEEGGIWTYTYDQVGNMLSTTDPRGKIITNTYDVLSRKTKVSQDGGAIGAVETVLEYDKNGNITKTIDPKGNVTTNEYDALGRLKKIVNPALDTKEFTYDGVGNITQTKDENGNTVAYSYNSVYNKTKVTDALSNDTTYTYDNVGNLLTETKPAGNRNTYTYDAFNRVVTHKDGENNVTSYAYDNNSNMVTLTKPNGAKYTYDFDVMNRNTKVTATEPGENPFSFVQSQTSYDAMDRITQVKDAMNNPTSYSYDKLGRLTKVTDALNKETSYEYDLVGNLTKEINAKLATTTYEYDNLNNMTKESDPMGKIWQFEYDKNGNISKEVDAKGQVNTRTYDTLDRLTTKKYLNGSDEVQPESTYFEYEKNGNLKKAYKLTSSGTVDISNTFTFDARSGITASVDSRGYNQSYTYNTNGNLASQTFADGKQVSYGYNGNDQISSLTAKYSGDAIKENSPHLLTTNFYYDVNSNLVNQVNPDRSVISKKYDAFDRVTEVNNYMSVLFPSAPNEPAWKSSVYSIAKYNYTLNNNGDKTKTEFFSNCDKTNECNQGIEIRAIDDYTYDVLGRLLSNTHTINAGAESTVEPRNYSNFYTYDEVGNRTELISTRTGAAVTTTSTYNLNNQLLSETGGDQNWSYTYDDNGNRLSKTNSSTTEFVSMTWDRANNMVEVDSKLKNENGQLEDYRVNYKYDAFGRRITRDPDSTVENSAYNNIVSQNYVYDRNGWDMVSEYTDIENGSNVHTNYYMAKLSEGGVPALIAAEDVIERALNYNPTSWDRVADESSSELDPEHNFIVSPDSVQRFAYYQRDALDSIVSKTNLEVRYKASDSTGTFIVDPTLIVNEVFKVSNQNRTDEYGRRLNDTQTTPEITVNENWTSRGYSGQVYDVESQTYYYGSRNYDPTNGTWTKLDSYRGEYKSPLSRNRYIFVEDDPVNEVDQYGFSKIGDLYKNITKNLGTLWNNKEEIRRRLEHAMAQEAYRLKMEALKKASKLGSNLKECAKDLRGCKNKVEEKVKQTLTECQKDKKKCIMKAVKTTNHVVRQTTTAIRRVTTPIVNQVPEMPSLSEIDNHMKEFNAQARDFLINTTGLNHMNKHDLTELMKGNLVLGMDLSVGLVNLSTLAVEYGAYLTPTMWGTKGLALAGHKPSQDNITKWHDLWGDTRQGWGDMQWEAENRIGVGDWKHSERYTNRSLPCNIGTGACHIQDFTREDTSISEKQYIIANLGLEATSVVEIGNFGIKGIKSLKGGGKTGANMVDEAGKAVDNTYHTPKTKAEAKEIIEDLDLPKNQTEALKRSISKATTTSNIEITKGKNGDIVLNISRSGKNGYQIMEYTVKPSGAKRVVQKAYDEANKLVHYDPKSN